MIEINGIAHVQLTAGNFAQSRAFYAQLLPFLGMKPGYYSVLFEDPDGVRLEVNHVPGRGVFDAGGKVRPF
jgi:catechol 2,3-dioxygenase-like lactoylglutathione lyase family enzyme